MTKMDVDFLKACARCKKTFTDQSTKLLPCLHAVCEGCLKPAEPESGESDKQQNAFGGPNAGDKLSCPECSEPYLLSEVNENIFVQEWIQQQDGDTTEKTEGEPHPICTSCDDNQEATSFCSECTEWLCDQCLQAHKRVKVTKDHEITPKENAPDFNRKIADQLMYCKQHKQEKLKFFCERCDKLTCRDCQLVEHKDHKYQFLNEASVNYKQQLENNLYLMIERRKKLSQVHDLIEQRLTQVKDNHALIVKQVQAQADLLIKTVIQNARILLQNVKHACEGMARRLSKESSDLQNLLQKYGYCTHFLQTIMKEGSNLSLLSTKAPVLLQCGKVYNSPVEAQSLKGAFNVQYKHDTNFIFQNLHRFGAIFVNNVRYHPQDRNMGSSSQNQPANNYQQYVSTNQILQGGDSASRNKMMQIIMNKAGGVQHHSIPNTSVPNSQHMQTILNTRNDPALPASVSNLVTQMRMNRPSGMAPNSWSGQLNVPRPPVQGNVPPSRQGYNGNQPLAGNPPFQPMRLYHRPAGTLPPPYAGGNRGQTVAGQTITQQGNPVTVLGNQPQQMGHASGPPPLIRSPPQMRPAPQHSTPNHNGGMRPGSTGSTPDPARPASSDSVHQDRPSSSLSDGATPVRVKEEPKSKDIFDCIITSANIKGEKTAGANCSGNAKSTNNRSPGISDHLAEAEKNLDEVLEKLPLELGETFEHIDASLPSSNSLEQQQTAAPTEKPPAADEGKDGSSALMDMSFSDPNDDYCACCHNGGEVLCCDICPRVYHLQCHIPPLNSIPKVFVCSLCSVDHNERLDSPEPVEPGANGNGSKRKAPGGLTDKEIRICECLLLELFCHPNSVAFHEPVSKMVPNYYKIIATPMDFTTIKCKLSRQHFNHYNCMEDFLSDINLVFFNCATYNKKSSGTGSPGVNADNLGKPLAGKEQSEVGKAGLIVKQFFEELVSKKIPRYLSFVKQSLPPAVINPSAIAEAEESEPKRQKISEDIIHIS